LLLHEDGMSYKDLARIVGVNATSIAPLLARARRRFLRSMAPAAPREDSAHDSTASAS
jgi:DNA-directed RNA polymerase specialized sigma24 family protein